MEASRKLFAAALLLVVLLLAATGTHTSVPSASAVLTLIWF
jgi:hypothetical protein